ncbi:hypothetical protein HO133_009865 [Letharia lupina]|uniref:Uncharacterized protein n=1 Tax=Letharia lupina TaxID=560253 RepID=A0A8H6CLY7_9LECA|nr:uncharacterized protein HO133_009865 [Letharia lupina]KAF6225863.1 hypothetical protein HO133_009865 [Letharia lupina]
MAAPVSTTLASLKLLPTKTEFTIYTDYCNSNATLVPLESCTSRSISTFSVDCPQLNGTSDTGYITSWGTSVPSTTSPSTSSVPVPPTSSSQQTLATDIPSTSFVPESQAPTSQPNPATGIPRPTQSSSTTFPPSPSSSQGQKGSGNDGGLSGPSTIAIGVVLPGVGVIVAIIIGIVGFKRHRRAPRALPTRRWST